MRPGTHRDLKFWSKMRCFACKNYRWGLGHIETSNSGANHAVLHAQSDRSCLGPIETCNSSPKGAVLHAKTTDKGWDPSYSGANHAVLHAQNDSWCLGPIETCYSCPDVAVLHAKPQVVSIHLQRLVILFLKSPFCTHKTTGEGCNPYSFLFLC